MQNKSENEINEKVVIATNDFQQLNLVNWNTSSNFSTKIVEPFNRNSSCIYVINVISSRFAQLWPDLKRLYN